MQRYQRKAQTMTHISRQQHKYFGATVRITTLTNEHGTTELVVAVLNPLAGNYIERGRFVANSDMSYTAANALASQLSTTKGTQ